MFGPMDLSALLAFDPVPLRAQHNGWSPLRQRRFILALARGAGPDEAARALGLTRQSAYRLRKKSGGESFAAAWDRAQGFARSVAAARQAAPLGPGGIGTLLVPRYYRGRLIGFVQREDLAGAMRLLGRLDRLADRLGDVSQDLATDERLEAVMRVVDAGSYRSDAMPQAKASTSSTPGGVERPLTPLEAGPHPIRVRVKDRPAP
jgi:hypothetical protein